MACGPTSRKALPCPSNATETAVKFSDRLFSTTSKRAAPSNEEAPTARADVSRRLHAPSMLIP
eukprot:4481116-Prymnesium_polylepis.1